MKDHQQKDKVLSFDIASVDPQLLATADDEGKIEDEASEDKRSIQAIPTIMAATSDRPAIVAFKYPGTSQFYEDILKERGRIEKSVYGDSAEDKTIKADKIALLTDLSMFVLQQNNQLKHPSDLLKAWLSFNGEAKMKTIRQHRGFLNFFQTDTEKFIMNHLNMSEQERKDRQNERVSFYVKAL